MILLTTETTTFTAGDEVIRPLTAFIVDQLGISADSPWVRLLDDVVEPVLQILLIVIIAWIVSRALQAAVKRLTNRLKEDRGKPGLLGFGDSAPPSTRKVQRMDALSTVGNSVVRLVVWTIAILTILGSTFGINIGPLIAGAGIIGVALGFGAQDLVKDVLSGMFMLVEDQYGVGDIVDVGEATGVVEGMGLRTTRLRDVTGTLWHVPNGEIRRVGNMSQEWSRALLDIGVGYTADVDQAAFVIKRVADEMASEDAYRHLFLADPEVWGVESLSADSVVIRLVIKTKPGEQYAIARELRRRIKLSLDEAEIEIPFPQRTIWVRDGNESSLTPRKTDHPGESVAEGKGAPEEGAVETATEDQA